MSISIAELCGLSVNDLSEETIAGMLGFEQDTTEQVEAEEKPQRRKSKKGIEREETDAMMAEIRERLSSSAAKFPQDEMATMIAAFGKEISVSMGEIGE